MTRITDYTSLAVAAAADVLPIVDVDDSTMSPAGTTKKITTVSLFAPLGVLGVSGDTTGATDTAAIAASLTATGRAYLLPGTWYLASPIEVDTNQTIDACYGAVIEPASGFTGSYMVTLANPASTTRATIRNLFLSVFWATNSSSGSIGGVQIDNTGWTSPGGRNQQPDPAHVLQGIRVMRASGDAYHFDNNARELRVENCTQYDTLGYGFYLGDSGGSGSGCTDSHFSDCTSGQSASDGWLVLDANNHFTNCKGFGAGNNVQTSTWGTTQYNWNLSGSHCVNNVWTSCSGQQAALHGWYLNGCSQCAIAGCDADSNGAGSGVTGYGFLVNNAVSCTITGCVGEQSITPGNQVYGIAVSGTNTATYIAFNPVKGTGGTFHYVSGSGYALLDFENIIDLSNANEFRFGAPEFYENSSVETLINGGHIVVETTNGTYPVSSASAVTGVILDVWTHGPGANIKVVNIGSYPVTFDVAGTSNVADGTSDVLLPAQGASFVWDDNTDLWYRMY
jgi:hypothetical protein